MEEYNGTTFFEIYCSFLGKVTDDMFLNMTLEDTIASLESILDSSISMFQFPQFRIRDIDREKRINTELGVEVRGVFNDTLTVEEIDILSSLMLIEWINRQITTTQLLRIKYSTQDFKSASQANHIAKLTEYLKETKRANKHKQRLYGRRRFDDEGRVVSNADRLVGIGDDRIRKELRTYFGKVRF